MIIDTLSALRDARFSITAHCNGCQHSTVLDLDALIGRLGPSFVAIGNPNPLAAKLSCAKCRGRDIGLILSPPSGYGTGGKG